ncbi:MAG: mechanosensitive ion channel family protein [Anaerolineales bacterium]|nr:mechanosensitive ion channel family protein [Anaerolineales bacterium]
MSEFEAWVESLVTIQPETFLKLLLTVALLTSLWLLRRWSLRVVLRRITEPRTRYTWQRASAYLTTLLSAGLIAVVWIESVRQLGTFLGLLSAGLAIALKDPLTNLIGWAYILWRKPFSVGDRIEIGAHAGDVIDVNLFQFALLEIGNWVQADQSTGRIIHVPNSRVLLEPLANYNEQFDYIWNEIPVLITFESDWQKAKGILEQIAGQHSAPVGEIQDEIRRPRHSERYYFFYTHLTPVVYTSVEASGIKLTVRYLCRSRQRRGTSEAIWEEVLKAFAEQADIQLAYPTQRQVVDLQNPPQE